MSGRIAVFSAACLMPAIYGTAKVNSLGCTPQIATSGSPSAANPNPFDITGSDVLNFRNGLLFYGFGDATIPFFGGTLNVLPPLRRTSIQNAGGTPPPMMDCSGQFTFDFKALVTSGLDPNLCPNTTVYAQYWARDPQHPDGTGTSLTDAVRFTLCP